MTRTDEVRHAVSTWHLRNPGRLLIALVFVMIYIWAIMGSEVSPIRLARGLPSMADFISRMWPPDFTDLPKFLATALETIQIAIVGTSLAAVLAFPLSVLAARNIMPINPIYHVARMILDLCRGISELIWGLLFVAMVGLGPFPGVLALAVHEIGALGKYYSETIEAINPSILDMVRSTGANTIQAISRGIVPELAPLFLNYVFYYFEHSVRAATVLGLVGAGGIGLQLLTRIQLFYYQEVLTILLIVVSMVFITDRTSAAIRRVLVGEMHPL